MSPPTSLTLRKLNCLNNLSSPDFHDKLCEILYSEEYAQRGKNLEGSDWVWLIDFLDKVRHHISISRSFIKSVQALGRPDPSGKASRKCLLELRSICSSRMVLPSSYILWSQDLKIEALPFAFGGFSDVFKGTFKGSQICVKRIRVYTQDVSKTAAKVDF